MLADKDAVEVIDKQGTTYDAFLLVSFGGPEGMQDVMPFLENVLRGRNVPPQRMLAVSKHYELFNGISPINERNRKLIADLKPIIESNGPKLPIYWGNRNWHPLLPDTLKQMTADGIKRAVAFVTAGYSSYSSCRQYLDNIENARAIAGASAPLIDKIRPFYNHPGFIAANAHQLLAAVDQIEANRRANTKVIFTAHSIPMSMAQVCRYEAQLQEACSLVMGAAKLSNDWQLAYQSRSGLPSQPWLEPDINDLIKELGQKGTKDVVIVVVGFVCDHMEVLYDLDMQAQDLCKQLEIGYFRSKTVQERPEFLHMIKQLVDERISGQSTDLDKEFCFEGCCPLG